MNWWQTDKTATSISKPTFDACVVVNEKKLGAVFKTLYFRPNF
jgi:hypothetical protein